MPPTPCILVGISEPKSQNIASSITISDAYSRQEEYKAMTYYASL